MTDPRTQITRILTIHRVHQAHPLLRFWRWCMQRIEH